MEALVQQETINVYGRMEDIIVGLATSDVWRETINAYRDIFGEQTDERSIREGRFSTAGLLFGPDDYYYSTITSDGGPFASENFRMVIGYNDSRFGPRTAVENLETGIDSIGAAVLYFPLTDTIRY